MFTRLHYKKQFLLFIFFLSLLISFTSHAQIVINEIRINPGAGSNNIGSIGPTGPVGLEYIELYNKTDCDVDISCWFLAGSTGTAGDPKSDWTLRFPTGTIIPSNKFLVVAAGGVTVPAGIQVIRPYNLVTGGVYDNINFRSSNGIEAWLQNNNDWKALYDASGNPVDAVAWGFAVDNISLINSLAQYNANATPINRPGCPNVATLPSIRSVYNDPQNAFRVNFLNDASVGLWRRQTDGAAIWQFVDNTNATPGACNGTCNIINKLSVKDTTICAGGAGVLIPSNVYQINQPPITATASGGQAEGTTFANRSSALIPALPPGAVLNAVTTRISGTRNCGSLSDLEVRVTPPASFAPQQTSALVGGTVALNRQLFGTWPSTGNPSGQWDFEFRKIVNCLGATIDVTNISIEIKVEYSLLDDVQWYVVPAGGTPIGTGNPFNPVGVSGSGLINTNNPGTFIFYAANKFNPNCRAQGNFIIKPVAAPVINCGSSTASSVKFVWAPLPAATGYDIIYTVNSNTPIPVPNHPNASYDVTGLNPTDVVNITVTPKGGTGACFTSASQTCKPSFCSLTLTSAAGTDNQSVCIPNAITPIRYTFGGDATGVNITGLPTGITSSVSGSVVTISGTATAGTYSYTITTVGCTSNSSATGTITINALPTVSVNSPSVCSGVSATVTATPLPGTPATYSYAWTTPAGVTNPGNVASFSANTLGTYSVIVTNTSTNCISTSGSGTITSAPSVTPSFSPIGPLCLNATAPALPSTSNNSIAGTWSPTTINTSTAGTATYTFTPDPGQCASGTTPLSITINALPTVTVNSPTICTGLTATITATAGTIATYSYAWTTPAGVTNPGNVQSFTTTTAGTYSVVITNTSTNCVSAPGSGTLTLSTNITPSFTPIGPLCINSIAPPLPGTSDNGITGTWNPTSINTSTAGTATYTFTPNSGQCATAATTLNISTVSLPTVTVNSPQICPGTTATITATPGTTDSYNYSWTVPSGVPPPGNVPSFSTNIVGTYSVVITSTTSGCVSSSGSGSLTVTTAITPSFLPIGPLCQNSTAPSLPTTSTNGITGTWSPANINTATVGIATYTFTPDAGQCVSGSVTLNVDVTAQIVPAFTQLGPFCLNATSQPLPTTSNNGIQGVWNPAFVNTSTVGTTTYFFAPLPNQCVSATPVTMDINIATQIPPVFDPVADICIGGTAPALKTTSNNGITGNWNPATISTATAGTATYTFTPNPNQCAAPGTLNVNVIGITTPTFAPIPGICTGTTAPLLPSSSNEGIAGTWNPAVVSNTASGTYIFTANPITGQCYSTASINISVNTTPATPQFDPLLPICINTTPAPVLPTTSKDGITGSWSPANVSTTFSDTYTFTPNPNQCATTTTLDVTIALNPVVELGDPRVDILEGESVTLSGIVSGTNSYEWTPTTDMSGSTTLTPVVNPLNDITYTLTAITTDGCTAKDTVRIIILNELIIPNIFSPNGDGVNDRFVIENIEKYKDATVDIFNRYGQRLMRYVGGYNTPWDGRVNGKDVPVGTYFYVIIPNAGKRKVISGSISIVR